MTSSPVDPPSAQAVRDACALVAHLGRHTKLQEDDLTAAAYVLANADPIAVSITLGCAMASALHTLGVSVDDWSRGAMAQAERWRQ